ncbi:MAG: hypothetical protein V5A38_03870 [Halolamina sp.]|uniref:hypothetical protein n=1 Tax=Halolamina sp. TaxID=1940283 RepID=UPI002FC2ECA8
MRPHEDGRAHVVEDLTDVFDGPVETELRDRMRAVGGEIDGDDVILVLQRRRMRCPAMTRPAGRM